MKLALEAGDLPGGFADCERTVYAFPTLAYTGARGATRLWTIRVRLIAGGDYVPITDAMLDQPPPGLDDHRAEITVESQQEGGKVRDVVPTYVGAGKNLGKKNATNCITQALRDALGLYNKQRRRTDVAEVSAAAPDAAPDAAPATAPDAAPDAAPDDSFDPRPPPMLVKKSGETREATLTSADFASGVTAQRKLNGVHLVVHAEADGRLALYSRTGAAYPGLKPIVAEMEPFFDAAPDANGPPYFDGELYAHGKTLNWISGQARRGDDDGALEFHVFDVFFPRAKAAGQEMASRDRQAYLDAAFTAAKHTHPHVVRVENFPVANAAELDALVARFLADGYEGAIARKDDAGYRYGYNGYHSANLLKIKPTFDAEFPVVGFTQGSRGKEVGAVIWECEVPGGPDDRRFTVVPKDMSYEERRALFQCLGELVPGPGGPGAAAVTRFERDLRGRPLTVEYREVSAKTGKPLQAKALAFRTYESGPAADPVRALLAECGAAVA
jgi:ATP-dependent DNA ligase